MPKPSTTSVSRRALLQRAAALGGLGAAGPLALSLAGAGEAAAFDYTDYRAIVCVFLYGGNDYANTVTPYDEANYDRYARIRGGGRRRTRGGIAYGRDELAATALTTPADQALTEGVQYALSPELKRIKALYDAGKAAVQLNVGPLVTPLTLSQYESANRALYPVPPKLFSHNDQQSVWQAMGAEGATVGWGGRLGDLAMDANGQSLLTCISGSGNAVFISGAEAMQYQISPEGAIRFNAVQEPPYGAGRLGAAMRELITAPSTNAFENELAVVARRSIAMEGIVNGALNGVTVAGEFPEDAEANPLAAQMKIVARLIGAREALGARRQVFFVSLEGFDHHNELMAKHPPLMAQLDAAVGAFYTAIEGLGVADKVTLFTASDFGRTLASNSDGSDHGWGGHHFVIGGAVQGGRFYGVAPHVAVNSDDQVGQGRLLPSTAVDQMAGRLALWFGAPRSELASVLPNIGNFDLSGAGYFGSV